MREIWRELKRLLEHGEPGALVTVIRTEGSAYQREGTKMLFRATGDAVGTVSGGCLEADLYEHCRAAINRGEPQIVSYDAGGMMDTVFGLGSGCLGTIELLIEPSSQWGTPDARSLLEEICKRGEEGERFAVVTILREAERLRTPIERLLVDDRGSVVCGVSDPLLRTAAIESARRALGEQERRPSRNVELGAAGRRVDALIDVIVPAQQLLVFGAGEDARPLARIAAEVGMEVTVIDWRRELLERARFPQGVKLACVRPEEFPGPVSLRGRPAIVLMSHHYVADRAVVERLVAVDDPFAYVGILGPRSRTSRLLAELETERHAAIHEALPSIRTPAGLDLGADTPAEIALAIVSEILATTKDRGGGPLTQLAGQISGVDDHAGHPGTRS
jgi:xanthine dehydrogenase accessory factor